MGINRITLSVRDLERSLAFYTATTGLSVSSSNAERALLAGPNGFIELKQAATVDVEPMPVEGPGVTHLCLQSPTEDELFKTFLDEGATTVTRGGAPAALSDNGVLYGYARDPDGIMFEVEQLVRPHFDDPIWIAHVALVSPDIDGLVDFYENLLGVAPYSRVNKVIGPAMDAVTGLDGARARAAWFNVGNMVLEIWQYITPPTRVVIESRNQDAPGYSRFVFEVTDLDAEIARLAHAGVAILDEPTMVDGGREVHAADPDGNQFGLMQLHQGSGRSIEEMARITWM